MTIEDAARGIIQMIEEGKEWISSYCKAASASQVSYNEEGGNIADDRVKTLQRVGISFQ